MSESRRKDLIYPTSDTPELNIMEQFENGTTVTSPNGQVTTSPPLKISNGFSSSEDSENGEPITMSRSCGQIELRKIRDHVNTNNSVSDTNQDIKDQSAYRLVTKSLPRGNALSVGQLPDRSSSAHSSPSHKLHPSASATRFRSSSPEVGKRIQSNPFFVQDRISRSQLVSSPDTERQRLDTAPAKLQLKSNSPPTNHRSEIPSCNSFTTLSPSKKQSIDTVVNVNIQNRIKLWAEKEKGEKEDTTKPDSEKSQSSPEQGSNKQQIKSVVKKLKRIEPTCEKLTSPEGHSSSSSLNSPTRSPAKSNRSRSNSKGSRDGSDSSEASPRRSRWRLKSPLFGRKKNNSESQSMDSEQSDENTLSSDNTTPKHSIGGRATNKRKAVKKRLSSALGFSKSNEVKSFDDEALMHKKPPIYGVRPRSNSVGPKTRIRVDNQQRASTTADASITGHTEDEYMVITSKRLDPDSEIVVSVDSEGDDTLPDLPTVFTRDEKGRANDTQDRTISRDIREIIDSLAESPVDKEVESPVSERASEVRSEALESGTSLDIVIHSPTSETGVSRQASVFSDEEPEPFITRGRSVAECSPIMSSLDIGCARRAAIKRRLSDTAGKTYSTKLTGQTKGHPQPRHGSLSPVNDGPEGVIATSLMYADAVWDRAALEDDELSFYVGDAIEILDMTDDVWWYGSAKSANGWFPASFVRLRIGQESDEDNDSVVSTDTASPPPQSGVSSTGSPEPTTKSCDSPPAQPEIPKPTEDKVDELKPVEKRHPSRSHSGSVHRRMTIRRKDSAPQAPRKLTSAEVRSKVIEEIINTERVYVNHLEDIIEGYVKRCRGYNKLFDEEKVGTIFSNIETIYAFQRDFLKELETSINPDKMEDTQIGQVFVNNRHEFDIYGQYCNNHPHAVNEMNQLQQSEQYVFFFESCRLLRNLTDISLEGFLLTPVQRICKYPLQLTELLKYTSEDHPDHAGVVAARDAMKEVAMHINEMKRRMENIGKIGRWQETIYEWKGADILESSTQMLKCGELHKISKGRSQERHFFLFDRQLIYCKKDAIGGKLTYKGRVYLDNCQITDMQDGTALHGSSTVKNAWRMRNKTKDKWYIIFARSPEEKLDWMEAFTKEREHVKDDEERKFNVTLKMKRSAVALSTNSEHLRRGRRKSSSIPTKNRVALVESVDSATKHKVGSQKLSASSPQPKTKTFSKKKKTS